MFRNTLLRRFCVSNKDPLHVRNAQNDHYKQALNGLRQKPKSGIQILGNFQKQYFDKQYLQRSEIETRILKILYDSEILQNFEKFNFSLDLKRDLELDSLNITVILTQIQHEFTTVFEDRVFESVRNLDEIVILLERDPKIF